MPWFYGSKAEPKKVFGEDSLELMAFYAAQESVAPGACMMMREMLNSWNPEGLDHAHTLPDGFNAIVPVLTKMKVKIEVDELEHTTFTYIYEDNIAQERGLAVAANITHACDAFIVREVTRRCNYDRKHLKNVFKWLENNLGSTIERTSLMEMTCEQHGFISLRAADFIREEKDVAQFSSSFRECLLDLVTQVLDYPPFPVLTIHDEFKCHPNHVNRMRRHYQFVLAEMADSCMAEQIISEVRMDPGYVLNKFSTDLGDEIMKGEYFLS
jgi:hypothetical protein